MIPGSFELLALDKLTLSGAMRAHQVFFRSGNIHFLLFLGMNNQTRVFRHYRSADGHWTVTVLAIDLPVARFMELAGEFSEIPASARPLPLGADSDRKDLFCAFCYNEEWLTFLQWLIDHRDVGCSVVETVQRPPEMSEEAEYEAAEQTAIRLEREADVVVRDSFPNFTSVRPTARQVATGTFEAIAAMQQARNN